MESRSESRGARTGKGEQRGEMFLIKGRWGRVGPSACAIQAAFRGEGPDWGKQAAPVDGDRAERGVEGLGQVVTEAPQSPLLPHTHPKKKKKTFNSRLTESPTKLSPLHSWNVLSIPAIIVSSYARTLVRYAKAFTVHIVPGRL